MSAKLIPFEPARKILPRKWVPESERGLLIELPSQEAIAAAAAVPGMASAVNYLLESQPELILDVPAEALEEHLPSNS